MTTTTTAKTTTTTTTTTTTVRTLTTTPTTPTTTTPSTTREKKKKTYSLEELALKISQNVEIKDRNYYFKTYKECFLGTDMVKYLISSGIVKNASEAVYLGNVLIQEDYIKHVLYNHGFKNEKLFYEFTKSAQHRFSAMNDIHHHSHHHHHHHHKQKHKPRRHTDTFSHNHNHASNNNNNHHHHHNPVRTRTSTQLRKNSEYRDNSSINYNHNGSSNNDNNNDANHNNNNGNNNNNNNNNGDNKNDDNNNNNKNGDNNNNEINNNKDCHGRHILVPVVNLSGTIPMDDKELQEICYAIFHSNLIQDRQWGLKTYPRCFVGKELVKWLSESVYAQGVNYAVAIGNTLIEKQLIHHVTHQHKFKNANLFYQFSEDLFHEMSLNDMHLTNIDLINIITEMKTKLEIKTRQYHGKNYPNCFIGSEACKWLLDNVKLTKCENNEAAILLGNYLLRREVIHHVTNQHLFENGYLFYQFAEDIDQESITDKWSGKDLIAIAKEIRLHVEIKDRLYYLKKYKDCFLGKDCVKYLVEKGICKHVPEAVALGNALIDQKIIRHVTGDHKFENGDFFYEFVDINTFDLYHVIAESEEEKIDLNRKDSPHNIIAPSTLLKRLSLSGRSYSSSLPSLPDENLQEIQPERYAMPLVREKVKKDIEKDIITPIINTPLCSLTTCHDDEDDDEDDSALYETYQEIS